MGGRTHPQPAFDFLLATGLGCFYDWYAHPEIDAGKDDDIRDYPEVWEYRMAMPEHLKSLNRDTPSLVLEHSDGLNLNALAIGLGLEDVMYEPEEFSGLVFSPREADAVATLFGDGMVVTGPDSHSVKGMADETVERIERLELASLSTDEAWTGRVAELIESRSPS